MKGFFNTMDDNVSLSSLTDSNSDSEDSMLDSPPTEEVYGKLGSKFVMHQVNLNISYDDILQNQFSDHKWQVSYFFNINRCRTLVICDEYKSAIEFIKTHAACEKKERISVTLGCLYDFEESFRDKTLTFGYNIDLIPCK